MSPNKNFSLPSTTVKMRSTGPHLSTSRESGPSHRANKHPCRTPSEKHHPHRCELDHVGKPRVTGPAPPLQGFVGFNSGPRWSRKRGLAILFNFSGITGRHGVLWQFLEHDVMTGISVRPKHSYCLTALPGQKLFVAGITGHSIHS